ERGRVLKIDLAEQDIVGVKELDWLALGRLAVHDAVRAAAQGDLMALPWPEIQVRKALAAVRSAADRLGIDSGASCWRKYGRSAALGEERTVGWMVTGPEFEKRSFGNGRLVFEGKDVESAVAVVGDRDRIKRSDAAVF